MKVLFSLAFYSLLSRKVSVFLTILCVSLSIILFSSIDNEGGLILRTKKSDKVLYAAEIFEGL